MVKRQKHNYTSELELKSLLIRIKNLKADKDFDTKNNAKINKYIVWHTKINNKKYVYPKKRNLLKAKLKEKIIKLSETTSADTKSYNRFGEVILLIIKNMLKKPQFSGYTYRDDFYSDAAHKILKYLHNFDHTKTSVRTGLAVNAFAYISEIIKNSILYIIKEKKKENSFLKKQVNMESVNHNLQLKNNDQSNQSTYNSVHDIKSFEVELFEIKKTLIEEINNLHLEYEKYDKITIIYPIDYRISFEEYELLKPVLKGKLNISRKVEQIEQSEQAEDEVEDKG